MCGMSPPSPRKVLMTADTVGGVWTFAMELCAGLAQRGVEVTLLSMGRLPDEAQQKEARAQPNLNLVATGYRLEWMQNCQADVIESGRLLIQLAAEFKPDVVHLNGYYHATLPFDAPVLLTAHSCVASWWRACKREPMPLEWWRYTNWLSAAIRAADVVVAPTNAFLSDFQRLHGPAKRALAIWNGRSASLFRPGAKLNFVLAAGRLWDEAKNIGTLVRAAEGLDIRIAVAGEEVSPDGNVVDLPNVEFLGSLSRSAMAEQMAQASVFASPARYEPFGLTILEAALSECALVLGDIPTLRELWDGAAIFVGPDDVDQWRSTLSRLAATPERAAELGRKARARALTYSAERMVEGYWQTYRTLLSSAAAFAEAAA
jgi:glycogen synthase